VLFFVLVTPLEILCSFGAIHLKTGEICQQDPFPPEHWREAVFIVLTCTLFYQRLAQRRSIGGGNFRSNLAIAL
jgi:hypothetical protein